MVFVLLTPVGLDGSVCTEVELELDIAGAGSAAGAVVVVVVSLLEDVAGGDIGSGAVVVVLVVVDVVVGGTGGWATTAAGNKTIAAIIRTLRISYPFHCSRVLNVDPADPVQCGL